MKREMSPALVGTIIAVAVLVLGGLGYVWFNKATGNESVSYADEKKAYEQAKNYYSDIGQKGPNSGRPGGNAEYEARMKSGAAPKGN